MKDSCIKIPKKYTLFKSTYLHGVIFFILLSVLFITFISKQIAMPLTKYL